PFRRAIGRVDRVRVCRCVGPTGRKSCAQRGRSGCALRSGGCRRRRQTVGYRAGHCAFRSSARSRRSDNACPDTSAV
nr:hypothetical protein [Tanacetum cinerariifolium]